MQQGKITLIFLVACLLIGGAGILLKQHAKTVRTAAETKGRVFEGLLSDQVKRIELSGADRHFEFLREGDRWLIQKPLLLRADKGEIDNLLYAIEFLEEKRNISPEEIAESKITLADYGLEKPRLTLKIFTDQKQYQVDVGHENRQSDGVYVRINNGNGVHLVSTALPQKMDQPLDQWRNRNVLDLSDTKPARIEIKTPKRSMEFARQNDVWRVVQPLNARASTHALDSLADSLTGLRADKFLSDESADLKKYHLDEPSYEITVKTDKAGDTGQSLIVGAPAGDQHWSASRKGSSSIVAVSAKFVASLDADLKDFRDDQLLHLDKRDVEAAEIRRGGRVIRVEKVDGNWKITGPKPSVADRDLVDQFLSRFIGLRIEEFTTDILTEVDKYDLGEGAATVRLFGKPLEKGKDAPVIANVRIGSRNPKKPLRYVKRDDESSVYGVSDDDARFIPSSTLDFQDRVFLTVAKDAVREVRLKTGRKEMVVTRSDKGDWVSDGSIDHAVLDKTVQDLSRLMAIRLVSENEEFSDSKYGFSRPAGEMTIIEKNGDEKISHEMVIGQKMDGRVSVFYKNKGLVAEIPVVVAEELTTPFLKK